MTKTIRTDQLVSILEMLPERSIWVVGDLMLDDYLEGSIDRISPEAPIQVVRVQEEFGRLGGAANVALGLKALGCKVCLAGVVGDDQPGGRMRHLCREAGIDDRAVIQAPGRQTTHKVRVRSRRQQLVRLDWETTAPIEQSVFSDLLAALDQAPPPDAIVLSDYAKGVLNEQLIAELVARGTQRQVPVLVDPKVRDFTRYRGASLVKPNLLELHRATGQEIDPTDDDSLARAAEGLCQTAELGSMLITLGEAGMALWTPQTGLTRYPALAREVYDVTGAGDTVMATMAAMLAVEPEPHLAAHLANHAAGITVSKSGTSVVRMDEVVESLSPHPKEKLLQGAELTEHLQWWRLRGKLIVFTNGCFDLLHVGHLSLLRQAASHGDKLIVGINTDASIRRIKGPERPLIPEHERAMLVAALDCVDGVVLFDEDTPLQLIKRILPDVLVKGADYTPEQVVGREEVEGAGGRLVLVELVENKSTSAIVASIKGSDPKEELA